MRSNIAQLSIVTIVILVGLTIWTSCSNSQSNLLDGSWQLRTEIRDNQVYQVDTVFYNFDKRVFSINAKSKSIDYEIQFGLATLSADSLILTFPDHPEKSPLRYRLQELTSKHLQLSNGSQLLQFRKF